jgi:hypothetical protein
MAYDEPSFLEDENYSPVRQGNDGSWLLDMTLLEDKVSRVLLYTVEGKLIKTIEDPYAVQQLAAKGELETGTYIIEVHGREMRYYLKMQIGEIISPASITIFPNPSDENISVSIPGASKSVRMEFYNMLGQEEIVKDIHDQNNIQIDTHGLANGVYLLKISDGEKEGIQKLVIQHK